MLTEKIQNENDINWANQLPKQNEADQKVDMLSHRYKKIEKIGTGTYGKVYMCEDLETGEIVAIKQIIFHVSIYFLFYAGLLGVTGIIMAFWFVRDSI